MKSVSLIAALLVLAGCANYSSVSPNADYGYSMVDPRGVDMGRYNQDYAECAALANQTSTMTNTAAGVGIGAVAGAVLGAAVGNHRTATAGAALGAAAGGLTGVASGESEKQTVLRRCLSGRGYRVIR